MRIREILKELYDPTQPGSGPPRPPAGPGNVKPRNQPPAQAPVVNGKPESGSWLIETYNTLFTTRERILDRSFNKNQLPLFQQFYQSINMSSVAAQFEFCTATEDIIERYVLIIEPSIDLKIKIAESTTDENVLKYLINPYYSPTSRGLHENPHHPNQYYLGISLDFNHIPPDPGNELKMTVLKSNPSLILKFEEWGFAITDQMAKLAVNYLSPEARAKYVMLLKQQQDKINSLKGDNNQLAYLKKNIKNITNALKEIYELGFMPSMKVKSFAVEKDTNCLDIILHYDSENTDDNEKLEMLAIMVNS